MSNKHIHRDAFNVLCGDRIGRGQYRTVFECSLRDDLVVKVEIAHFERRFANVSEAEFWHRHASGPGGKWLAPVERLSPDGRVLLMKRARPIHSGDALPDMLPSFLTDIKRENFGFIGDQLVCVDYAIYAESLNMRPRKVEWK